MRTTRRAVSAGLAGALFTFALALAIAAPTPVDAAYWHWRVSLSPTTLTEGTATNVSVSVTPGGQKIGLVVVTVPAGFDVISASISSVPAGFVWHASGSGSGPVQVTFGTTRSNWRLVNTTGVFTIRVRALTSPLAAWSVKAYQQFSIDKNQVADGPLWPPGPFVIVPGPTPTPTPKPTPKPTPTPTPKPKATATPRGLAPTPHPSSQAPASARPSAGDPSPSPSAASSPGASAGSAGPPLGGGPIAVTGGGGGPADGSAGLQVLALPAGDGVNLSDTGALGTTAMVAWLVPGLFLSLPALLIVIVVLIQAGFASAFIPLTRRFLAADRRRKGSARPRR